MRQRETAPPFGSDHKSSRRARQGLLPGRPSWWLATDPTANAMTRSCPHTTFFPVTPVSGRVTNRDRAGGRIPCKSNRRNMPARRLFLRSLPLPRRPPRGKQEELWAGRTCHKGARRHVQIAIFTDDGKGRWPSHGSPSRKS